MSFDLRWAIESRELMTEISPDAPPTTVAMLQRGASLYGDTPQIVQGAKGLSFVDVEARSATLALGLLAAGIGKGTRVGLLMPNEPDWGVVFFAITRIGAVAVLLSTFARGSELAYLIRHSDIDTLITADKFLQYDYAERLAEALPSLGSSDGIRKLRLPEAPMLRSIWFWGDNAPKFARGTKAVLSALGDVEGFTAALLTGVEQEITPADLALIIYTSGSTSRPKGVVHTHGSAVRQSYVLSAYMTFQQGDRLLTTQPFFWVGGLSTSLLAASHSGAAVVCPDTPSPDDILLSLRRDSVTHLTLWPAQIANLRSLPGFREEYLTGLKPFAMQQYAMVGMATTEQTPNSLGMTETFGPHSKEHLDCFLAPDKAGSFGRQVPGIERKIVDPQTGILKPAGEQGELLVRGRGLMNGFYKREHSDVFDEDGYYHTGDLCRICPDGHLFFDGRGTELIKTAGANVAPREVELALMQNPSVGEAAVLGLPHKDLGEIVVAVAVLRKDHCATEEDLLKELRKHLSSYKIPKKIWLMKDSNVPRTDSNKINKPTLRNVILSDSMDQAQIPDSKHQKI